MKIILWVYFAMFMLSFLSYAIVKCGRRFKVFDFDKKVEDALLNVASVLKEGFYALVIGYTFCYLVGLMK